MTLAQLGEEEKWAKELAKYNNKEREWADERARARGNEPAASSKIEIDEDDGDDDVVVREGEMFVCCCCCR